MNGCGRGQKSWEESCRQRATQTTGHRSKSLRQSFRLVVSGDLCPQRKYKEVANLKVLIEHAGLSSNTMLQRNADTGLRQVLLSSLLSAEGTFRLSTVTMSA